MKQYITHSEKETRDLAAKLAKNFQRIIALSGELGAGKTTFVQGFAKGLGIKEKIISPTFVLIRQHKIPRTKKALYHIDLYRLNNPNQFKLLGLEELFQNPNAIVLIEWADKIRGDLAENTTWIYLEAVNNTQRKITIS